MDRIDLTSGFAHFDEKLKEADLTRIKLYEDAIYFERHKKQIEVEGREKDMFERHQER